MADDILKRALKRKENLLLELKELEDFIRVYQKLSKTPMPDIEPQDVVVSGSYDTSTSIRQRRRVLSRNSFPTLAEQVLREHREPMPLRQLMEAIERKGRSFSGQNPEVNASSIFSRARNLEFIKGRGWWIANEAVPSEPDILQSADRESAPEPSGSSADDDNEDIGGVDAAA